MEDAQALAKSGYHTVVGATIEPRNQHRRKQGFGVLISLVVLLPRIYGISGKYSVRSTSVRITNQRHRATPENLFQTTMTSALAIMSTTTESSVLTSWAGITKADPSMAARGIPSAPDPLPEILAEPPMATVPSDVDPLVAALRWLNEETRNHKHRHALPYDTVMFEGRRPRCVFIYGIGEFRRSSKMLKSTTTPSNVSIPRFSRKRGIFCYYHSATISCRVQYQLWIVCPVLLLCVLRQT